VVSAEPPGAKPTTSQTGPVCADTDWAKTGARPGSPSLIAMKCLRRIL